MPAPTITISRCSSGMLVDGMRRMARTTRPLLRAGETHVRRGLRRARARARAESPKTSAGCRDPDPRELPGTRQLQELGSSAAELPVSPFVVGDDGKGNIPVIPAT